MKTKNIPLDKEAKLAFARSRQVPTYVLFELVKSEHYDVDVVRKIVDRNDIPEKLLLEIIRVSKVRLENTTDTVSQSKLKDLIGFVSYKYSTWHNMSGKAVLEKYQPRTSSAGSSLSDSSNQKNELAQTYIEDKEILKSDLKNDIINPEDKDYGHKVNDTNQQGENKDQTLYPAKRDTREVDEDIRRGEKKRTNKIEFQRDDKMLDIGRDISSIEEVFEEKRFKRNTDRGSDGMVRSEIEGEGVSGQMVQPREEQDFLECCKKALAEINRRGIGVVLFGQGSLRAYAVLKGFKVRETVDLDFINEWR